MCGMCEQAAEIVAGATGGALDAEDVLGIVRAFREASEGVASDPETMPTDQEVAAAGLEAMQEDDTFDLMTILLGGRPHVVIVLDPVPGRTDGAFALGLHGAGIGQAMTTQVLEAALLASKHTEAGGVTESGVIVSPGVNKETRG